MICIIISTIIGYLLGCSNMSYYISKHKKVNIKGSGSKNYGAANTAMLAGLKAGVIVFVHDFAKALIAVCTANYLFPGSEYVGVVAGCASVVGHIFPFYLKFDGGKGYAPFIGMSIALYPVCGLLIFLASIVLAFVSDYVVASTFSFIVAIPITAILYQDYVTAAMLGAITMLVFVKHKENIKNLVARNGKEPKMLATLKKKRVKKK